MKAVLNLFWQICLMRQGPEYVPTYPWFVGGVVCANLLGVLTLSIAISGEQTPLMVATYVVVTLSVTAALTYLACYLREVPSRFLAAFTAICGCDLIITILFALLLPVSSMLGQAAAFLPLCFMVWSVTVVGFILHRALDTHLMVGIATAIGISLLSVSAGQVATAA